MHWYILGAGAVGRLWACLFQHNALPVTLLLRDQTALHHWQDAAGIEFIESATTRHFMPEVEVVDNDTPIRHLLVTTKAYDTLTALRAIQHRLQPGCKIVLLQNGMGQHQAVLDTIAGCHLWAATTTAGAWRESPNRLHCVSRGETVIGPLTPDTATVPPDWDTLPLTLTGCADIESVLWRKLAINCAINPLTAIENCRNGELLENPQRLERLRHVCTEVEQVASAAGIQLFTGPLHEQAESVARATGGNLSSMLQDVRHQRPTEIEQITGYLCNRASQYGIATPVNAALLVQVRALTLKRDTQDV